MVIIIQSVHSLVLGLDGPPGWTCLRHTNKPRTRKPCAIFPLISPLEKKQNKKLRNDVIYPSLNVKNLACAGGLLSYFSR